ncbi:MAG: hypothetical protein OXU66_01855 [Gammaproteobacteria bacterium]|nr:hypothetical protein [Gammaproteobacteria bacterium]MDD9894341.1 hypothetical protein [Gammaproteobacteria bacterium]MDD9957661.1 hypothetical protein [Gammaproteobacteria bacterium]
MQRQWFYTGIILFLFLVLVFGVPLFPELMAIGIAGPMNLGMLIFLLLHVLTPLLAFRYLKQTQGK